MQKARQAWTFVDFGQKNSGHDGRAGGGGDATDCAGLGFGAILAGGFCTRRPLEVCKTVAGAYFGGCGTCTQYDPKVIVGVKTPDPKGDAYYGS